MNSRTIRYLTKCAIDAYDAPIKDIVQLLDSDKQNRGYMIADDAGVLVAISGTQSKEDFIIDCKVIQEHENGGMVHSGFWDEYEAIRDQVFDFLNKNKDATVRFTGHSLGAAIATYATEEAVTILKRDVQLLTLGSPRPGDCDFAQGFNEVVKDVMRIVHRFDIVPRIPKINAMHVAFPLHLDSDGSVIDEAVGLFQRTRRDLRIAIADVTGEALRDHYRPSYLSAVESYLSSFSST